MTEPMTPERFARIRALDQAMLLHIWTEVAIGRGRHGAFLTEFAEAVTRADPENFVILREAMFALITKYRLDAYLDTFAQASGMVQP